MNNQENYKYCETKLKESPEPKASKFKGSSDVVKAILRKEGGGPREPFHFLLDLWGSP